ncbi:MAG: hypothetical protein WCO00_11890 [Rhodospirillaceae bacterium]
MKRLDSWSEPVAALLSRVRPALERTAAAVMATCRGLEDRLRTVDWAGAWRRWREDPRPLPQRLLAMIDETLTASRFHPLWERLHRAWTWAVLHDTVPREATARRREWWMGRQQRQEQREVERIHRKEELAKKREKKDEEERQTYSVYFE